MFETFNVPGLFIAEQALLALAASWYSRAGNERTLTGLEFVKYDTDGAKWLKTYHGVNNITKKEFTLDVGYERFLGPEIFFHPEDFARNLQRDIKRISEYRLAISEVLSGGKLKVAFASFHWP
ncbi:unnamed protein product [Strongylus vulgaris]|uniref:Uncharacterized protein n=1 Tax=Strongylus vulgaris TaxID=40348 RepID=A0A3P7JEA9_STRVU|nr:unnamed protein product [Strongylus vulgaris]